MTYFGTDGIRMQADQFTPEFLTAVIRGLLSYAGDQAKILIGGDTRESTEWILADLEIILATFGIEYGSVGVMPTPAIYYCFSRMGFNFAIDITASHNPASDNGLKIFELGEHGPQKLSAAGCAAIEQSLAALQQDNPNFTPLSPILQEDLHTDALDLYRTHLLDYLGTADLHSLHLGIDCANGAMSVLGGRLFQQLGASVHYIHADATYGTKINHHAGSTHLTDLRKLVQKHHLDFGIAFDGDGDRCLLIDETGTTVDGDQILAMLIDFLGIRSFATTVMANQGLLNWARDEALIYEVTPVGDTAVAAAMLARQLEIGAEQSGHVILPGQTTGDGMLTALMVAKAAATTHRSLSSLASIFTKLPQITVNLPISATQKTAFESGAAAALTADFAAQLDPIAGRLLVRPSGTENLLRITMWGDDADQINALAHQLATKLEETL